MKSQAQLNIGTGWDWWSHSKNISMGWSASVKCEQLEKLSSDKRKMKETNHHHFDECQICRQIYAGVLQHRRSISQKNVSFPKNCAFLQNQHVTKICNRFQIKFPRYKFFISASHVEDAQLENYLASNWRAIACS